MADTLSPSGEYIGNRLAIFLALFTLLQLICVILRFMARRLTARPRGLDDWLVTACLLSQFVSAGIAIGALKGGGVGYHSAWLATYHPALVPGFLKYLIAIASWYAFTNSLAKLAIIVFYRTLFPQRSVHIILWITAGIMICTSLSTTIAELASCRPFSANWDSTQVQAEKCIDKEKLYVWASFPNIITDVVLLVLPLPITWRLHTNTRLKMALTFTFVIGSIGLISTILRFLAFNNNNSFLDATWNAVELVIWTNAEPGIYLIAACLMTYRPLLDKFSSKIRATSGQRSSKTNSDVSSGTLRSKLTSLAQSKPATRPAAHFPPDGFGPSMDGGISLSNVRARSDGFEYLSDPEDSSTHAIIDRNRIAHTGIVKTTDIQMSWAHGKPL